MRLLHLAGFASLLLGCGRSPYQGYKVVGDDVHFRLRTIGDGEILPTDSDSVRLRIRMGYAGTDPGGVFSTERTYRTGDLRAGALVPVLRRAHTGDSISVIAPAAAWPWAVLVTESTVGVPDTGMIQAEISLLNLRTPAMIRAEAARLRAYDPLGYERRLIDAYLRASNLTYTRWGTSDLYYCLGGSVKDTAALQPGDEVTIAYEGRRLEDGRLFDDTKWNGAPLTFVIGDKDQVMNGLEVALGLMRNEQEGFFIFPSAHAFGTKGIPGVLAPYSPVTYKVRVVGVVRQRGAQG